MGELPWFPFYAADWLTSKKRRKLTWAQRGVYADLLAEQWVGGALPSDPAEVAAMIGASTVDVTVVLELCFFPAIEGWLNDRLEEVRTEQAQRSETLSNAGRKGGIASSRKRLQQSSLAQARLKPGSSIRAEQSRAEQSRTEQIEPSRVKAKRKAALPSDWMPNEGHRSRAMREGVSIDKEAELFRLHYESKGETRLDWDKTFTTWLIKAKGFQRPGIPPDSEAARYARDAEDWRPKLRMLKEQEAAKVEGLNRLKVELPQPTEAA